MLLQQPVTLTEKTFLKLKVTARVQNEKQIFKSADNLLGDHPPGTVCATNLHMTEWPHVIEIKGNFRKVAQ